ncbi:hypothetical protein NM688_g4238 [Phlebia brevispora]|uniref:Uncharacterized protein n=1 Tax=Phlebia brevispora TaxID=194682 RepID=A0ACC1T3F9_9APHY|nr:hypothetical protein NM688_g4238 [Phlebia brevispora]
MNLVPELIYKVLEFVVCINVKVKTRSTKVDLYDDDEHQAKDTLLACSVLSRTWRDCTLPHLYHTVAMYCDPRRKHYINAASRHYRRLEDFVAFLAAFPQFQPLIKDLRVFFPRDACTEGLDPEISRDREAHDVLLVAKVIDSLPQLRVLHLLDVRLHSCGRAAIQALGLASQRTLHRFEYVMNIYRHWREMDGILDLLSLFSDIKALYLQGVSFQELIPDGSVSSEQQNLGDGLNMNLETLRLVSCARVEKFVRIFGPIITAAAQPRALAHHQPFCGASYARA